MLVKSCSGLCLISLRPVYTRCEISQAISPSCRVHSRLHLEKIDVGGLKPSRVPRVVVQSVVQAWNVPEYPAHVCQALVRSFVTIRQIDDEDRAVSPSRRHHCSRNSRITILRSILMSVQVLVEGLLWTRRNCVQMYPCPVFIFQLAGLPLQVGHLNGIASARCCKNICKQ